jgi:FkbM family methyltransferase
MLHFLQPGDTFVDVGANAGLFTLIAANAVGRHGQVFAFEPTAKMCKVLLENMCLNNFTNVHLEQCALSNATGQLGMMVAEDDMDAFNSFAQPHKGEHYSQEIVSTRTWDDYANQHSLQGRVALMKIDVEGWESNVLLGGFNQFSREDAPVLQVEFTDEAAKAAGTTCRDNYRLLESLGYKLYIYERHSKTLKADPIREEYPYLNLFAVKNLAACRARLNGSRIQ